MTAREMSVWLDAPVTYRVPGTELDIYGTVTDVRTRFGSVDVKFVPVAGAGEKWLAVDSVTLRGTR